MDPTSLERPLITARTRRAAVTATIAAAALFTGGLIAGATLHRTTRVERINVAPAPVNVTVPQVPAPVVSVNVPEPVAAPEPPPVPVPVTSPPPMPRPLVPRIWAECVTAMVEDNPSKVCGWDDGFPAIAEDGSVIATKYIPDDGGRGNPGLEIHFLDANTGKTLHAVTVLNPGEYVVVDSEGSEKSAKDVERMRAKIARRVTAVQKTLDDGHYRTMALLGGWASNSIDDEASPPIVHTGIYAEIADGGAARVIDPATNTVLWQTTFGASSRHAYMGEEDMCGGWGMRGMSLWWDPSTRVVVSSQDYQTGGCMCPDETVEQVGRMPAQPAGR